MPIHDLIPKIMAKVGAIAKGRTNQHQNYKFRGIDDAYAAFQPLFAEHGVFVVPTVLKSTREERENKSGGLLIYTTLEVKHTFFAADGTFIDCVTVGEAMDSGDKSSNKAMSAAMKYALLEVFCVPTEADNDTENHSPEPLPKQNPAKRTPEANKSTPTKLVKPIASLRELMILRLLETFDEKQLLEYCFKAGILLETEKLSDIPEKYVAKNKADLEEWKEAVTNFGNGAEAEKPFDLIP